VQKQSTLGCSTSKLERSTALNPLLRLEHGKFDQSQHPQMPVNTPHLVRETLIRAVSPHASFAFFVLVEFFNVAQRSGPAGTGQGNYDGSRRLLKPL
jgi:hypothetical protein